MIEKHYTIAELAEVLNISLERTRQLVMDEPGVLTFAPEHKDGRPTRRAMYRIPDSVVQRILRRSESRSLIPSTDRGWPTRAFVLGRFWTTLSSIAPGTMSHYRGVEVENPIGARARWASSREN